jgi:deoxycytidine triphosphate deaminase
VQEAKGAGMAGEEPKSGEDKRLRKDPRDEVWANWQGAVLLSDEIEYYATLKDNPLIDPFDPGNLKPARYKLRLGENCRVGDKECWLSDENQELVIEPYELAVISTYETLNLPSFLIGRWDLKVKRVYEGLLWVGGPQVDPGFKGKLSCPLYNLSSKSIKLKYKDTIATIDFVKTTTWNPNCRDWEGKPNAPRSYYDRYGLRSGLSDAWQRMEKFEEKMRDIGSKINRFEQRIDTFQAITFTILGIIVAALAVIAVAPFGEKPLAPSTWQWITFAISLIAIIIAIVAVRRTKR